jgi:hypothetical protein
MHTSKSHVRAFSEVSLDCASALFQGTQLLRDRAHARDASAHSEGILLSLTTPTADGTHGTGAHGLD